VIDKIERLNSTQGLQSILDLDLPCLRHRLHPADGIAAQDGMIGEPYNALKKALQCAEEGVYGAERDLLLLVQYESLPDDPAKTTTLSTPIFASGARARLRPNQLRRRRIR
jgi:hypothetical protein